MDKNKIVMDEKERELMRKRWVLTLDRHELEKFLELQGRPVYNYETTADLREAAQFFMHGDVLCTQ